MSAADDFTSSTELSTRVSDDGPGFLVSRDALRVILPRSLHHASVRCHTRLLLCSLACFPLLLSSLSIVFTLVFFFNISPRPHHDGIRRSSSRGRLGDIDSDTDGVSGARTVAELDLALDLDFVSGVHGVDWQATEINNRTSIIQQIKKPDVCFEHTQHTHECARISATYGVVPGYAACVCETRTDHCCCCRVCYYWLFVVFLLLSLLLLRILDFLTSPTLRSSLTWGDLKSPSVRLFFSAHCNRDFIRTSSTSSSYAWASSSSSSSSSSLPASRVPADPRGRGRARSGCSSVLSRSLSIAWHAGVLGYFPHLPRDFSSVCAALSSDANRMGSLIADESGSLILAMRCPFDLNSLGNVLLSHYQSRAWAALSRVTFVGPIDCINTSIAHYMPLFQPHDLLDDTDSETAVELAAHMAATNSNTNVMCQSAIYPHAQSEGWTRFAAYIQWHLQTAVTAFLKAHRRVFDINIDITSTPTTSEGSSSSSAVDVNFEFVASSFRRLFPPSAAPMHSSSSSSARVSASPLTVSVHLRCGDNLKYGEYGLTHYSYYAEIHRRLTLRRRQPLVVDRIIVVSAHLTTNGACKDDAGGAARAKDCVYAEACELLTADLRSYLEALFEVAPAHAHISSEMTSSSSVSVRPLLLGLDMARMMSSSVFIGSISTLSLLVATAASSSTDCFLPIHATLAGGTKPKIHERLEWIEAKILKGGPQLAEMATQPQRIVQWLRN